MVDTKTYFLTLMCNSKLININIILTIGILRTCIKHKSLKISSNIPKLNLKKVNYFVIPKNNILTRQNL